MYKLSVVMLVCTVQLYWCFIQGVNGLNKKFFYKYVLKKYLTNLEKIHLLDKK